MNNYTRNKLAREIRKYYLAKEGLLAIDDKIKVLQSRKSGVKGIDMSAIPNFGGGSRYEDSLLDIISDLDMLEKNKRHIQESCVCVEKALMSLSDMKRELLLKLYGERCNIEYLKRHFNYEKSAIYSIANKALEDFGLSLYGE
uniref:Uncharacterized protein n=1 Tax=Myoviridae sp. ct1ba2 TaxID=2827654 RepID=A0A8S5S7D4_9CAUD|nr:MAG TPA: Protein of unknown function (DUF1492) [Myoviridae sp. ct1ba2]